VTTVLAVVLPETGARLEVTEVELAPPGPGEVLVRLHASGVCHSDLNAIDGTAPTRCPVVLGHEGAGVVEQAGPGVALRPGQPVALSWIPWCGRCEECLRGLAHLCRTAWGAMGHGGLLDGTPRLSRQGEPVYHYSLLSTFAERAVVAERSCVPVDADVPLEVAALVGCAVATGVGAVWNTAGVRPGERVAVLGCGGVGLSAILGAVAAGAAPVLAVDVSPEKLEAALALGATDAVRWAGDPEATAEAVRAASGGGVDYAVEASGRPEVAEAAFLSTRARGAAVLVGIPRADAELRLPALSVPRMERRVLGSAYGSTQPARDFPTILGLYRSGRLPLDRLISHRLPLEEVEAAFALLRSGGARRVLLEPRRRQRRRRRPAGGAGTPVKEA
jgi:Zn-dependent alcohol dehydrogenase